MRCEEIKCIVSNMMHNVKEAKDKIEKAYAWREKHKGIADWFRTMAASHIDYNNGAHQMVRNGLQEMRSEMHHDDVAKHHHAMGKCEAYEEWLEQIVVETAEVKAMIEGYGRNA